MSISRYTMNVGGAILVLRYEVPLDYLRLTGKVYGVFFCLVGNRLINLRKGFL